MHEQSKHKQRLTGAHSGLCTLTADHLAKQIVVAWGSILSHIDSGLDSIDETLCELDPRLCKAPVDWRLQLARAIEKRLGLTPPNVPVANLTLLN